MPISHKHKVIFIHIPKCAGTSIEHLLEIDGIDDFYTEGLQLRRSEFIPKEKFTEQEYTMCCDKNMQHYTVRELAKILDPDIFNTYKKIAVVRNPYTRLVSEHYFRLSEKVREKISFEELVRTKLQLSTIERNKSYDGHLETQTSFLINEQGNFNSVDKIYKYENLRECLSDISAITGNYDYPHLRTTNIVKPHEEHYTPELREIVYNFYKEDFINFNY